MKKLLALIFILVAGPALAAFNYQPVQTYPGVRLTVDNQSSTIAVTNTFQQIWALNDNRVDCMIQNNGTNNMWVFPGGTGSATKGAAAILAAGQAYYCSFNGVVYQGAISITGTAADAYYATSK